MQIKQEGVRRQKKENKYSGAKLVERLAINAINSLAFGVNDLL